MDRVKLTTETDPQQAVDNINVHDHTQAWETPIPTEGIADGAIIEKKIASSAVTTTKIADNAVTEDKLSTDLKKAISNIGSSAKFGFGNFIASGLKVKSISNLTATISAGSARINESNINILDDQQIALQAKKASLIYLDSTGTLGKVDAQVPTSYIDDNTIAFWLCNQTVAGANIPNIAVGKSKIAVENDLVPHGGIASVDGWADNALQLDGLTGFLSGSNTTNFPVGAAEREMSIGFNLNGAVANAPHLCGFGGTDTNQGFFIAINTSGNLCLDYQSYYDTGFYVDKGKKLIITFKYDSVNKKLYTFANGTPLGNPFTIALATIAGTFYVGNYLTGNYCAPITVDFVELRNKMRQDAQTAEIANKFIMPCFYDKAYGLYPVIPNADKATAYHEYKFDETSGTVAADTAGTSNGTAGASSIILDSPTLNGKSRKCDGTLAGAINLGIMSFPSAFTIVGVITPMGNSNGGIFSNRLNGSIGTQLYIGANNKFSIWNGDTDLGGLTSTDPLAQDSKNFFALAVNNTKVDAYVNSANPTQGTLSAQPFTQNTNPLYLGYDARNAAGHPIAWDYLLVVPRTLSQAEIAEVYNSLMVTGRRNIIDDIIPTNAISLGFIRTNSSKVIEKNDSWYKYGRREGATGGNRRIFLPWKYFSGSVPMKWDNPFGSGKYKVEYHWAQDIKGTNEIRCNEYFENASGTGYGMFRTAAAAGYNDSQNIVTKAGSGGAALLNNSWQNTGYIGGYAEVMEDYKGADVV